MRLEKRFAEVIFDVIEQREHRYLGAIQDGRVVLGGTAGSAGGSGNPPAGFWGQLAQSNITYDTDAIRACATRTAGSNSLVDNLDRIRLGDEICNDAIQERHIDWGTGGSQVSAVDVPFATTSGSIVATNVRDAIEEAYGSGGGAPAIHDHSEDAEGGDALNPERISSRLVVCGPGLPNATLGAAVARVNALGPPAINSEWVILVLGRTAETGDVTIPSYCCVVSQGQAVIDMGNFALIQAVNASIEDVTVTGTGNNAWYVVYVTGNDAIQRNLRVIVTGQWNEAIFVHGCTGFKAYHVICETTQSTTYGFYFDNAEGTLWDCQAYDPARWDDALFLDNNDGPSTVTTHNSQFRAQTDGDDVHVVAGSTWNHDAGTQFDPDNSTIDGTEVLLPHGRSYFKGGIITRVVADDVSDPPTDAELDTAFGQPATLSQGFMGIVDDNGAQTKMWLCVTGGSTWWYEELTKAV